VTEVEHRSALAGLRGLGRARIRVLAMGGYPLAGGLWSRFASARAVGPSPTAAGFVARVNELARQYGPLVVYPGTERSLTTLLQDSEALDPQAVLAFPTGAPATQLRDKRCMAGLALDAGLHSPAILAQGMAAELRGSALPLPCVVKSAGSKGALDPARFVDDPERLAAILAIVPDDEPLLVQEAVAGPLTAVAVVVSRDGRLVARHQQTAERIWPPTAGGSSAAVSVRPDEELARRSARLAAAAGYWGLAHMQFMDSARGPLLIDINPRFYGSMPLALACGVNLPAAWHAVVTGGPLPTPGPYAVGVRYRRLEADLAAASHGAPRRLLTRTPRPKIGATWAPDDPLAGAMVSVDSLGRSALERARELVAR
jgi:predicted ATP-grasp superfamily ATP-dependent carboligase